MKPNLWKIGHSLFFWRTFNFYSLDRLVQACTGAHKKIVGILMPPTGPTVWQWVTEFINLFWTSLMACKWFILFVQIDAINHPSVADFFFAFSLFWSLAAPTTCSGQQNLWTLFRYHFWYVNILSDRFKLILMTYITVASLIFAFSPIIPADPTVWPWVRSFVSVFWTALLVFKRFIPSAQIDGIDLPFRCRSLFGISPFWLFAAPNTQQWLVVFISTL